MAFVLIGHMTFGHTSSLFARPMTAIDTCFMMLLGFVIDDYRDGLLEIGGKQGQLWLWMFYLIMQLLLLNMVLAIIFDVYTEVSSATGDAPSLVQQAVGVYR